MRYLLILLLIACTSVSNAARLSATSAPAVGDDGTQTVTVFIELEAGETLRGVDARFTGDVLQSNPFGSLATIFNDNNGLFQNDPNAEVSRDSQFLFTSGDVLSIGAEEDDGLLKAAISGLVALDLQGRVPLAQIATMNPCDVSYSLSFDLGASSPTFTGILGSFACIPEPSTCLLAGLAVAGFATRRNG